MITLQSLYERAVLAGFYQDIRSDKFLKYDYDFLKKDTYSSILKDRKRLPIQDYIQSNEGILKNNHLNALYPDSGLHTGEKDQIIERVLVGIDCGPEEVLYAKTMNNIDLVIGHHPVGKSLINLPDVMSIYHEFFVKMGISLSKVQAENNTYRKRISQDVLAGNYGRTIELAKLYGLGYVSLHTPADNSVQRYLCDLFFERPKSDEYLPSKFVGQTKLKDELLTLQDTVDILSEISEQAHAIESYGVKPQIFVGEPDQIVDRMLITMTGGTNTCSALESLALTHNGVSTVMCMHATNSFIKECEKKKINVVCSTHMPSDSIGMNRLFDFIELEQNNVEIFDISSFYRVQREPRL